MVNKHWNKIIESPTSFGQFRTNEMFRSLGIIHENPEEQFARQILPYTLAAQNFASETVNFFVENGKLTTLISKPINKFFKKDTNHKMRLYFTNVKTMMYERHHIVITLTRVRHVPSAPGMSHSGIS